MSNKMEIQNGKTCNECIHMERCRSMFGVKASNKECDFYPVRFKEHIRISEMTPSQQAKAAGIKSLLQVSELTGVSIQTLSNWAKNKPKLFRTVILGAKKIQEFYDGV